MTSDDARKRKMFTALLLIPIFILGLLFLSLVKGTNDTSDTNTEGNVFAEAEKGEFIQQVPRGESIYEEGAPLGDSQDLNVTRLEVPPPTPIKDEEPLPYDLPPAVAEVEPSFFIPPVIDIEDPTLPQVFTYEQLKNLKVQLLELCRANAKAGYDGVQLRDRLITIFNATLGLTISVTDMVAFDVVYHPQVNGVIQSIDSATCKDKNPMIPTP